MRFPHQMLENTLPTNGTLFRKLEPKRPTVLRRGDLVHKCFFHEGMGECLGVRCYWPRVGKCLIFDRIVSKAGSASKKTKKTSSKKTKIRFKKKSNKIKVKIKRKPKTIKGINKIRRKTIKRKVKRKTKK